MDRLFSLVTVLALAGLLAAPAKASPLTSTAAVATADAPTGSRADCRLTAGERIDLAQGMPIDCCKGHKGICGCRAGKIVCCDGTVSKDPNCTCYSDWGVEN